MCTGKTTIAKQLAKYKKFKLLPEVARLMHDKGYKLDKEITVEVEMLIAEHQEEIEKEEGSWVADRCFVDLLAYTLVLFPEEEDLHNDINDRLDKAKYDIIFYTPIEFPIRDDGVRSTNKEFQTKIDDTIKDILKTIPHVILRGTKEARLKKAILNL